MLSASIKQLSALLLMVLLAVSGVNAGGMDAGACLFDKSPVTATAADDDPHCLASMPASNVDHHEISCSPFAQPAAGQLTSVAPASAAHWLTFQPFPQRLPQRLDKPPRVSLPL